MADKEFRATVMVRLKNGVLDPQGKAIEGALGALDFDGVKRVRQGKTFDMIVEADSKDAARDAVQSMCEKLLANTVIEDYSVEIG